MSYRKVKVLLTRHWPGEVEQALRDRFDVSLNEDDRALSPRQLRDAMSRYDALCPCVTDQVDADVLRAPQRRVQLIAGYGVGYDHIDTECAREQGITVTNTPDVLTDSTADLAMTLMLMVARRAGEGERQLRAGRWRGWYPTHLMGTRVSGATLGIVGLGRIGRAMARRARHGFGMKILYHNRSPVAGGEAEALQAEYCPALDDLLARSDFVALHCPGGAGNTHLMDAERLRRMRPSACLINTSRGTVVDEQALATALREGWIAGAGLDVYADEPRVDPGLLGLENAVLLPHLGSATRQTRIAMGMRVLDNLERFFGGDAPSDMVVQGRPLAARQSGS